MAAIPGSAPAEPQVLPGSTCPRRTACAASAGRALLAVLLTSLVPVISASASPAASAIPVGGRVVDEAQAPIAGVRVSLLPPSGWHEGGRLLLAGSPAAAPTPAATAASAASAATVTTPATAATATTPTTSTIAAIATTDAQGRYELAAPGPGMWRVRVEAPGRVPVEYALTPLLDATELPAAAPPRDAGLELRVTDGAGKPLAARAAAHSVSSRDVYGLTGGGTGLWQTADRLAATGPDGRLRIARAASELLDLVVAAPGRPPVRLEIRLETARRAAAPTSVDLPAGTSRTLRAVDERGRPVAGALVWDEHGLLPLGETAADGRWTAAAPRRDALRLRLSGPDGRRGTVRLAPPREATGKGAPAAGIPAAAAEVVVPLSPAARLAGRVLDRSSRAGVAGAFVWLDADPAGFARADRAGGYELGVPAGSRGALLAAASGHVPARSETAIDTGSGERGPTLLLPPAARLAGRVVDAAGRPVAGAEIHVAPSLRELALRDDIPEDLGWDPASYAARSDAAGRFRLAALHAGWTFDLQCARTGFATAMISVRVPEPPEPPREVEVVLAAGRRGTGRVADGQGRPVAGARVLSFKSPDPAAEEDAFFAMQSLDWGGMDGPGSPGPTGTSGADGRFALSDLGEGSYELAVQARGFAPAHSPAIEVGAGPGEVDLGTVTLEPGATVEGRVVDAAGRPVPGAEVDASFSVALEDIGQGPDSTRVAADADGRFTLDGLTPGAPLTLSVISPGFLTRLLQDVVPPTREPLRVVLERGARLAGRVLDPARRPVAGATVGLEPGSGVVTVEWVSVPPVQSDEEGAFELAGVPAGSLTLRTRAAGFQPHRLGVEVPAGGERTGLELVLSPGAAIVGRVLDTDGEPVPGARVRVFEPAAGQYGMSGPSGVADGDGRFRLEGVSTGPRVVQAAAEGRPPASREIEVAPGENQVTLTLPVGLRISGRVVDQAGNSVGGVLLTFQEGSGAGYRAISGEDGTFTAGGLSPGTYHAQAIKSGYVQVPATEPIEVRDADLAGVEVRLAAGSVTLTGRLLGIAPGGSRDLSVHAFGEGGERQAAVDAEGRYRMAELAPGSWVVFAMRGMNPQAQRALDIPEGVSEVSLDLDLAPEGFELTGVALRDGAPIRGAMVVLSSPEANQFGSTDQEGAFRFEGLAPGSYRVAVQDMASGLSFAREVEVDSDESVRLELGSGRIAGRVVEEAGGAPIPGAAVELRRASDAPGGSSSSFAFPGPLGSRASDSNGAFRLEAPEGAWRVVATKVGYAPAEATVELEAGAEVAGVELRLASTEGITLEVALASGLPLSEVQVAVLSPADQVVSTGTFHVGEGGRVRVGTVPPGRWDLLLQAGDSATVRLPVSAPGAAGRVVLPPAGGIEVEVAPLAAPATPADAEGDAGSAAAVAATLSVLAADGRPARFFGQGETMVPHLELWRGRAGVTGLAPGRWTVRVTAADGRTWTGTADVVPGQVARVRLQ